MKINHSITLDSREIKTELEEPEICPQCTHAIKPEELGCKVFRNNKDDIFVCLTYLCKHCYKPFLVLYSLIVPRGSEYANAEQKYIGPNKYKSFETHISEMSPRFVEIYNQAVAAEALELDDIAGVGYRKALEFLIKDYLVYLKPEDESIIKNMGLGNCISNKVENDRLKIVASRCAWIGNDMTHYVQKFENKDIGDMKRFIDACVYWISAEFFTKEALEITKSCSSD